MIQTSKIGIVGVGHVGAHVAYCLLLNGVANELLLCDIDEKKLIAEVKDLNDCLSLAPHNMKIVNCGADYEQLSKCDIIINAAGNISLCSNTRDGELFETTNIARTFAKRIVDAGFSGIFVSVSNPCDVVATKIFHLTGYEPRKIIGSGCVLDSSRLKFAISNQTQVSPESIDAYMIGEHGRSEIAMWSGLRIAGKSLEVLQRDDRVRFALNKVEVEESVRLGGYAIYCGKRCTEFAIALSVTKICIAILNNEHKVLCVSSLLDGQYGESGIYSSLPCQIGSAGIEYVYTPDLSQDEIRGFKASCAHIKDNLSKLDW